MARLLLVSPLERSPALENSSFKARMPRYGTLAIASALHEAGHEVRVQDEYVGDSFDLRAAADIDVALFSVMSYCAPRAHAMAARLRAFRPGLPLVIGGPHPSVAPEDALRSFDVAVRNEGEAAVVPLVERLVAGQPYDDLPGLSFLGPDGAPVHRPAAPFLSDLDGPLHFDLLPSYRPLPLGRTALDSLANGGYRLALPLVQATRGCPYGCRFCFVGNELGRRYRKRSVERVLDDIARYLRAFRTPYLFFADNDLTLDSAYSTELFSRMQRRFGRHLRPWIFSRLAAARDTALMTLLNRFDWVTLGVGVEAIHEEGLAEMGKGQHADEIEGDLERLAAFPNLHVNAQILFGWESDTRETIARTVDFGIRHRFHNLGMAILYDFPGREAALGQEQAIPDALFLHEDYRFFNGNFVVHFPKNLRPSELQEAVEEGFVRFHRQVRSSYHPFRPVAATARAYARYLRRLEAPYYDAAGCRSEDRIASRTEDRLRHVPLRVSPLSPFRDNLDALARSALRPVSWRLLAAHLRGRGAP